MTQKYSEERYLQEIQAWQDASKIHAKSAIKQYERVSQALEEVYFEKRQNAEILAQLSDAVIALNADKEIVLWNHAAANIFEFDQVQMLGQHFDIFFEGISSELVDIVEHFIQDPRTLSHHQLLTYQQYTLDCKLRKIQIAQETLTLLLLEDVTEIMQLQQKLEAEKATLEQRVNERTQVLKQAHEDLEQMVTTDQLTQLSNRLAFEQKLKACHQKYEQDPHAHYALLFLDLDGFKLINDTLGHKAGDELLQHVAQRLTEIFRQSDFIARLGGDEFVILVQGQLDRTILKRLARHLIQHISQPYLLSNGHTAHVTASVGICESTSLHTDHASEVLSMADHAMYQAKQHGKNRYEFFESSMEEDIKESNAITVKLARALEDELFEPYFQPICNIHGNIIGAEVLARWPDEEGFIPPYKFVPLLERKGLISQFSQILLKKVVRYLEASPHIPCVSFNLSVQQFYNEDFIDNILQCTETIRQNQARISFEVTESIFSQESERITQKIQQLRSHGFRVYIDDFGTGYSAFSYLKKFEADVIKIDREFVIDITENEASLHLLYGIISLIKTLGMQLVIEGVENTEQLALIRQHDDSVYIQGYHFYRPIPFTDFQQLIHP